MSKVDCKTKKVSRDKEGHNDERISPTKGYTIINIYAASIRALKYIKQV